MRIYVQNKPRSLALATETHVLVFWYFDDLNSNHQSGQNLKCIAEFLERDKINMSHYNVLSAQECLGFLGVINVGSDIYLCTMSRRTRVGHRRPEETIYRIDDVEFHCLTRATWDHVPLDANGKPALPIDDPDSPVYNMEHPCTGIKKLLCDRSFFFSTDFDLSSSLQAITTENAFLWNTYMMSELMAFKDRLSEASRLALKKGEFLTTAIRGYVASYTIDPNPSLRDNAIRTDEDQETNICIISRQSWKRAGTRYNARGIDDEGNVANYVETETCLYLPRTDLCFSYVQIRGSVPTFWEQEGGLLPKLNLVRSPEAAQPAFNRHTEMLEQRFESVNIVNLLATDKASEAALTARYHHHVRHAIETSHPLITMVDFDFHAETAQGGYSQASRLLPRIDDQMRATGFYCFSPSTREEYLRQSGVFRVNCLDCLDRTNVVQEVLSRWTIEQFLEYYHDRIDCSLQNLWSKHSLLWADNGDMLSKIYTGTNALKTSFLRTGRMSLAGTIADVTKNVGRLYVNNFVDKGRQSTLEQLLGRAEEQGRVLLHDPINDFVTAEMARRKAEFTSTHEIDIFAGTFNVNGCMPQHADLTPWLFPPREGSDSISFPHLVLVGLQEVVELTASQVLSTDPARREFWEKKILACLNEACVKHRQVNSKGKQESYVLLMSANLVGTLLVLYGKQSEIEYVTDLESCTKKTGLGGMAGNKGGVAVRFNYAETSFCFVTAHLAAGMDSVDQRHQDYKTIASGTHFSRGRRIKSHDTVIWLGDFNYRVELSSEIAREKISQGDYGALFEADQLNLQMVKGETFPFYSEMPITFAPTYKFDNGTDVYDTSEKNRTPSWTDRILSRGANLRQLSYGSAPIMFSDHRPVHASYRAAVVMIDKTEEARLRNLLYNRRRDEIGDPNERMSNINVNVTTITNGLPPPSSDTRKWWISAGLPMKVPVVPPHPGMVLNGEKVNPFSQSELEDFITPPALPRRPLSTAATEPERTEQRPELHKEAPVQKGPPAKPEKPDRLKARPQYTRRSSSSTTSSNPDHDSVLSNRTPRKPNTTESDPEQVASKPTTALIPPTPPASRKQASLRPTTSLAKPNDLRPLLPARKSDPTTSSSRRSLNLSPDSVMDDPAPQLTWRPMNPS